MHFYLFVKINKLFFFVDDDIEAEHITSWAIQNSWTIPRGPTKQTGMNCIAFDWESLVLGVVLIHHIGMFVHYSHRT